MKASLSIFIFLFYVPCIAQNAIHIKGIITDEENQPISDVMVSVNWSRKGILSENDGSFYLTATRQDTLVFKHLSFEPKAIALISFKSTESLLVKLKERTITLQEVNVTNLGSWDEFQNRIKSMNTDSIRNTDAYRLATMFGERKSHPIKNPYYRACENPKLTPMTIIFRGLIGGDLINMLYSRFSGNQKRRRKIEKEMLQEITINKNRHKYSIEIISQILNIEKDEAKQFKIYADHFVNTKQSGYKILKQIQLLYKEWTDDKLHQLKSSQSSSTVNTK